MNRSQNTPKRLLILFMAVTLLSASTSSLVPFSIAYAEPSAAAAGEAPATIDLSAQQLEQLNQIETQELVAKNEAIDLAKTSINRDNDLIVETKDGRQFVFSADPPTEKSAQEYAQFNDLEKARFHKTRAALLAKLVPILVRSELTYGIGSLVLKPAARVVSGAIKGAKYILYNLTLRKNEKLNPFAELAKASLPDHQETPKNIRERGAKALKMTLKAIDKALWNKSYELVNHNQFVFKVSIAMIGQGGQFSYVLGGSKGLGFRVGYDSVTKRLIYDVIVETEKLDYAAFCPLALGPMFKIGVASYANKPEGRCIEAKAYYVPGPPLISPTVTRGRDFSELATSISMVSVPSLILVGKTMLELTIPWLLAGTAGMGEGFTYKASTTTRLPAQRKNPSAVDQISASTEALAYKIKERDRRQRLQELRMSADSECEIILTRTADE